MQRIDKVLAGSQPSTPRLPSTQGHSSSRSYEPQQDCPLCRGAGFVYPTGQDGEPVYNIAKPCRCLTGTVKAYTDSDQYRAGQGARPVVQTFDNFVLIHGARDSYNAAKAWTDPAADFIWLIIYGGVGNGKSHLCNAALNVLLSRGQKARLITASSLLSELRMAMSDHTTDVVMRGYQETSELIIDDLGAGMKHPNEPGSEWEWSRMEELLVSRYDGLKPTMVATNLDWSELPERIASRFQDREYARMVQNAAPDYRREK